MTAIEQQFRMVDFRGETHDVLLERYLGGYAVRVDGDLLFNGEAYETRERAFEVLPLAWGQNIKLT